MTRPFSGHCKLSRGAVDSSTHQTTDRSTVQEEHDFLIHEMKSDPTLSAPNNIVLKLYSVKMKSVKPTIIL